MFVKSEVRYIEILLYVGMKSYQSLNKLSISGSRISPLQSVACPREGVWRVIAPHFSQDGARDFLKIDEKISGGRG